MSPCSPPLRVCVEVVTIFRFFGFSVMGRGSQYALELSGQDTPIAMPYSRYGVGSVWQIHPRSMRISCQANPATAPNAAPQGSQRKKNIQQ
jgi:hypothetical protein